MHHFLFCGLWAYCFQSRACNPDTRICRPVLCVLVYAEDALLVLDESRILAFAANLERGTMCCMNCNLPTFAYHQLVVLNSQSPPPKTNLLRCFPPSLAILSRYAKPHLRLALPCSLLRPVSNKPPLPIPLLERDLELLRPPLHLREILQPTWKIPSCRVVERLQDGQARRLPFRHVATVLIHCHVEEDEA